MQIEFIPTNKNLVDVLYEIGTKNNVDALEFKNYHLEYTYDNSHFSLKLEDIKEMGFSNIDLEDGDLIAVKSCTEKDKHILMLDIDYFSDSSFQDAAKIKRALNMMHEGRPFSGYLLRSGQGYHYYENLMVDKSQWEKWMVRTKKDPILDAQWLCQSAIRGYSCLRCTAGRRKEQEPKVIYEVRTNFDDEDNLVSNIGAKFKKAYYFYLSMGPKTFNQYEKRHREYF